MFRSLRITIFTYYFLTVGAFLGILHYFLAIVEVQNIFLLTFVMLCLTAIAGVMISKLAIDPLQEHIDSLQNLSKDTLHELNIPISTIVTNSQMLKKGMSDEKQLKRLSRIQTACEMLQLRYDELDYMIKTQTLQELSQLIELGELVKQRVEFLSSIYGDVEFNLELKNLQITNDKIGLAKVIDNLIDNGVKYSKNNHRLDISIIEDTLYIKDYGCGMDEVELLQIFDRYYQSNENMQGYGIGLNMVKKFCDKNDIKLSFISKLDEGTTVLLRFKDN